MSFKASHLKVGEETKPSEKPEIPKSTSLELSKEETELLLVTIKNSLFKGEYVEILYNLTLKLQNHYKNIKL